MCVCICVSGVARLVSEVKAALSRGETIPVCVYMCVCVCVCLFIYIHIHLHIYTRTYIHTYVHVGLCVCVCVCVCVCTGGLPAIPRLHLRIQSTRIPSEILPRQPNIIAHALSRKRCAHACPCAYMRCILASLGALSPRDTQAFVHCIQLSAKIYVLINSLSWGHACV